MARYLLGRLIRNTISLFLFLTVIFLIVESLPGDYVTNFALFTTPEQREAMREEMGLDRPVWLRYLDWLRSFFVGGGGWSLSGQRPVREMIVSRLPGTLYLFIPASIISFAVGVWLGKLVAWRRGQIVDTLVSLGSMWLYASFLPLVAFLLVQLTSGRLGWQMPSLLGRSPGLQGVMFQPEGIQPVGMMGRAQRLQLFLIDQQPLMNALLLTFLGSLILLLGLLRITRRVRKRRGLVRILGVVLIVAAAVAGWVASGKAGEAESLLYYTALPMLTLVLVLLGEPMLLMRTTMMETMRDEYVMAARAKGLPNHVIRDRHAARTALLPVVSRVLLSLPFAFTGSLVVETLFSWPGIGSLLLFTVDNKDYSVVIGIIALIGGLVVLAHVVLDLLNLVLDPRVRSTAAWKGEA